jgi:hypothetical protein
MGTTILEVANRALGRIGAVRITALTDTTASAKAVSACFPGVPDWVLRSWLWKFAINRVALTNPEAAEGTDWTWKYTLPPDCLDIVPQDTPLDDVEFVEEAGTLLCDLEAPLWLRYARQVTDPGQWDPAFAEVLSWKLALEMQPELAPAVSPFTLSAGFESALKQALRSGAVERQILYSDSTALHFRNWEEARR